MSKTGKDTPTAQASDALENDRQHSAETPDPDEPGDGQPQPQADALGTEADEDAPIPQLVIPYVLEDQVGHLLRRANQRHTAIFADLMGDDGLTPMQFAALVRLAVHGPLSQNRLGRLTAMDPATVQGVIRRLAERDLIVRVPDQQDRRRMKLNVSQKGSRLVEGTVSTALAITDATLAPLSPQEQKTFVALLRRLI